MASPYGWCVGGAITDGASICLLRVVRENAPEFQPIDAMTIEIVKPLPGAGAGGVPLSTRTGGHLYAASADLLPPLPIAEDFPGGHGNRVMIMTAGRGLYVPPESYLDPRHIPGAAGHTLNSGELCVIAFRASAARDPGGPTPEYHPIPGGRSFILRRPPIVLVHGIYSEPGTWDTSLWNEFGSPVPTRVYKVDYSATSMKGFTENYSKVVKAIDTAVNEYRNADDAGHHAARGFKGIHYAATRADVVAHSMGGQLARWYIADTTAVAPAVIDRPGWTEDMDNFRALNDPNFRWPYLRPDNWGAGSIRRLVTLNSPFKGSPMANEALPTMQPGDQTLPRTRMQTLSQRLAQSAASAESKRRIKESRSGQNQHTCLSDLSVLSVAYAVLEAAPYPTGRRRVLWHPVSSEIGPNPPSSSVRWAQQNAVETWWVQNHTNIEILLNNLNSDWVVTVKSQKNLWDWDPRDPRLIGSHFVGLSHSHIVDANGIRRMTGVTGASDVRGRADLLFSTTSNPGYFGPQWSIGP